MTGAVRGELLPSMVKMEREEGKGRWKEKKREEELKLLFVYLYWWEKRSCALFPSALQSQVWVSAVSVAIADALPVDSLATFTQMM